MRQTLQNDSKWRPIMVQTQAFFQLVGDARRSRIVYRNSVLQSRHMMHHLFLHLIWCLERRVLTKRAVFLSLISPWKAQCLALRTDGSNEDNQFCLVFFRFAHQNSSIWMLHKHQIMTNLIFTIPPPYVDEGIIAILALQRGYEDTMTLTSKAYINFGMQSSRFTQHSTLFSMFKAFLFLASVMALNFAGLHIRHPGRCHNYCPPTKGIAGVNWHESYSEPHVGIIHSSSEQRWPALRRAALLATMAVLLSYAAANEMVGRGVLKITFYYTTPIHLP